ncbi:MAG TPA: copper homeostasis membrane protein CopD [Brevundimonas sp.]|uniref:copper homeostasis membrane protein CopD n=1 Tax=Brevundimonas sp. TaxID=1871086 RepID=UPI002DE826AF|nr:copper homeostasis membrane protein CopD [Brevundimonas sp.]
MPIDLTVVALRWVQFGSAVVALGLPLFQVYASAAVPGTSGRRVAMIAGLVLAVASAFGLFGQTAMMAGSWEAVDAAAIGYVVQSMSLGTAHVVRAGLALLGTTVLLLGGGRRSAALVAAALFAGATASFAWSGHGASSQGPAGWIHLMADIVHALAGAVWLGALIGFSLLLLHREANDVHASARSLTGFGTIGTAAVAALAFSGVVNAAFLVGPDGSRLLTSSDWGQLLVAKLALFLLMIWLAAQNRYSLTPRLNQALTEGRDGTEAVHSLRLSVGLELAAGVALLGLVAAMGVQSPPASM